jgi:hypothetical protein
MRLTLFFAIVLMAGQAGVPAKSFSSSRSGATSGDQSQRRVTIPAGTRILVRTTDNIDSQGSRPGSRFTAELETNLDLDGVIVAPRGAPVHGRLVEASAAGRTRGRSRLTLELTDIVINGAANPIFTESYEVRGRGQSGRTARRGLRGAGLGALVGGIAGGGGGAAVGAAVGGGAGTAISAASGGQQISIPSESLLEFRLAQEASLPVSR